MYVQEQFVEDRPQVLRALVADRPLATFICGAHNGEVDDIEVNHFPLLWVEQNNGAVLQGHIPRANPLSDMLEDDAPAVAVFHGAQSYITPSWYPGKAKHGKVVPTWNYVVVHVRGVARVVSEEHWLREHLAMLTDTMEADQSVPWKVADAPASFTSTLLEHIVGVELRIETAQGKWKVSQNRSAADRMGVQAGLEARGDDAALAVRRHVAGAGLRAE